ncbi:hypothetical protein ACGF0D_35115 [Kitasatospora sp. NPDC048298]|uniref:zinc finger domain-containing protein n=1 Tax=Kitasatospora sp. NPDC048298 TaxID=3364049 RepID=UPI00371755FD
MREDRHCCAKPRLTVRINGYDYRVDPVEPEELPACTTCGAVHDGPWRVGAALSAGPGLCGRPKKDGTPCRWRTDEEPCPNHLTPEQEEQARVERAAKEERQRKEQAQRLIKREETAERNRQHLALMFSVACPHCSAPVAEVCRAPRGVAQRAIHADRRRLAGVSWPKEFVLYERESYFDGRRGSSAQVPLPPPPPLDADLRELLADPLEDWTAQASAELAEEHRVAAERKAAKLRRSLWRLTNDVTIVSCPVCEAERGHACATTLGKPRNGHDERVDLAMAGQG